MKMTLSLQKLFHDQTWTSLKIIGTTLLNTFKAGMILG